jgi:Virulence activator alpha C-term
LKAWVAEPPTPRAVRDEMVLKAYSVWLVAPEEALALFREQEQQHREQLARYEETEAWMQKEWGRDLEQIDSSRFASYATLRRGKGYEREYAGWCGWLAGLLEKGAGQIKEDRG